MKSYLKSICSNNNIRIIAVIMVAIVALTTMSLVIYDVVNANKSVLITGKNFDKLSVDASEDINEIDIETLKKENPEIVGWLIAEGLGISEPIMQGEDNEKYLTVSFDGKSSKSGALFMDYECAEDFSDKHTIIYGHNLVTGGMLSPLVGLKKIELFEKFKNDITIITPQRKIKLQIIASDAAPSETMRRTVNFANESDFQNYANGVLLNSRLQSMPSNKIEKLFSLITCSYEGADYRTYIYAVESK
ncbi:MAG: class B sortase [Oscillospiraceae bacterium]